MEEINELIEKLAVIKAAQKVYAEKETFYKDLLMKFLKECDLEKEDTEHGSVRIQRRSEKDYGEEVRQQEASLKQLKRLKDDIGDFTVVSTKESLVFNLPKDLFWIKLGRSFRQMSLILDSPSPFLSTDEWKELQALRLAISEYPFTVVPSQQERFTALFTRTLIGKGNSVPPL